MPHDVSLLILWVSLQDARELVTGNVFCLVQILVSITAVCIKYLDTSYLTYTEK